MQDKLVSQILLSDVSDHYSTLTKIGDFNKSSKKNDIYFRKCNLSKKLWNDFNFELGNILNENFPSGFDCDVNHQANIISKAYKILVDKYMPLKKLSKKKQKREDKPWMTAGLKTSRKKKFELLAISNLSNDAAHYQEYKKYLNTYTNLKKESRHKYYRDRAAEYGHNKAKMWMLINEIANRKRKSALSLKCIKDRNGKKLNESLCVANCLIDHFSSVGKRMASEIENNVDTKTLKNPLDYLPKTVQNSLFFIDIDVSEVLTLISEN